jgi:hypothetical protein
MWLSRRYLAVRLRKRLAIDASCRPHFEEE